MPQFLILIFLVLPISVEASQIPTNLMLKCEGTVSFIIEPASKVETGKFEKIIRLKNGEISDADSPWLTAGNCKLTNDNIRCSDNRVVKTQFGSERRKLEIFLARETGEYHLFLEAESYKGPDAKGKSTGGMKLRRNGICRPVGGPLF